VRDYEDKLRKLDAELESRLKKVDRESDRRIAQTENRIREKLGEESTVAKRRQPRGSRPAGLQGLRMPDLQAKVDLYRATNLAVIDRLMEDDFSLNRHFGKSTDGYPTVYCETLEEFFEPHVRLMELSDSAKQALVDALEAQAEAGAAKGGVYGVNWPGEGCYLNGWLFAYGRAKDAAEALNNPRIFPRIIATAAHEKLGHGFITEFTASGEEKRQVHMWQCEVADRFEVKLSDTPEHALLREKWNTLLLSSMYVEEGWATWVERYIMSRLGEAAEDKAAYAQATRRYTREDVERVLRLTLDSKDIPEPARQTIRQYLDLLGRMLDDQFDNAQELHAAMQWLAKAGDGLEPVFIDGFHQSAPYVIGCLMMDAIAGKFGTRCAPYAVASASNVTYSLDTIANADLSGLVEREPNMNMNTRLAMLLHMSVVEPDDVSAFLETAKEELGFAPPFAI